MELISSRTNSLADAVRIELGEKTKSDHIQKLRRQRDEANRERLAKTGGTVR